MKQTFKMVFSVLLFAMSLTVFAQNANDRTAITGKVVDKDGLGVAGLNVIEKGTKHAVLTDFDGAYKIQVPKGAVLQFSFIGMKTVEKTVGASASINVTMLEDNSTLNEVVVVGYGTQKKGNLTGAIATIKPDDIQDLPVSNLAEALRGQVPGVSVTGGSRRPGTAASITIRQNFAFSKDGSTDLPLIVIDDMVQIDPTNGRSTMDAFNRLDPSEIESITILKDGSAAIYGSRASQGAIIVKTKRGKEGEAKFTYFSQFAINDAVSHSKTMNAYDYGVWSNRFLNSLVSNTAAVGTNGANLFTANELEQMKSLDYNWLDKAWKVATQQKHALTVSGGTDKATYFAGVNYFTEGANLGKQDYAKWNFRAGTTVKVSKNLDFSSSVSASTGDVEKSFTKASANINDSSYGTKANGGGEQQDYGYLLHMPQYIPWETTVDGTKYYMSPFAHTYRNFGSANINTNIAGWNYFATLNNGSKSTTNDFSYNVNMSLNYKVPFIKGLSLRGTYARSQSTAKTEQVQLPYTLARILNYNTVGHHLESQNNPTVRTTSNPLGDYIIDTNVRNARVYYDANFSKSVQSNFFASYDRTFGDHDISLMVGVEKSENDYSSTRLAYENTTKDYNGTYATAGTLTTNSTALRGEGGTLSYLGRFNYSYKNKYLFQFIMRSDASTKFAPSNYWGVFPGAQVGWVVSKENWFADNVSWVDNLKLRYSIGKTGKDNIAPWRWQKLYDIIVDKGFQFGPVGTTTGGGVLGSAINTRVDPNPDAGWDSTIKNNVGIDLAVLDNRLQITADYYYERTNEALTQITSTIGVPISVGGGFAEQNYASYNTTGSEFSVNWSDKVNDKFKYNVGVNFGFSGNKMTRYMEQALALESKNVVREGSSLNNFPTWGFNVWKETSTGDGILRTQEDIDKYWDYLTASATAVGGTPAFFNVNTKAGMKLGALAYKDLGGVFNTVTGVQSPADGKIAADEDYTKLTKNSRTYGFTTNLGFNYSGFYMKSQIATSWGGYRAIDVVKQGTSSAHNMWAHESYWKDMYSTNLNNFADSVIDGTGIANTGGKYPNLALYDDFNIAAPSDFWQLNTFRCVIRNLTLGFEFPKQVLSQLKIAKASLGVTGNNLWDLYNPYPDHYRNMYDSSYEAYPTLRTWTVNLNVTF